MTALWIFTGFLAVCVLVLSILVAALARQIGILHERSAPLGALVTRNTADITKLPDGVWDTLDGKSISLPISGNRHTLLMFVSSTCPVCKKLLPIIDDMKRSEGADLDFVFASDGDLGEHLKFHRQYKLESYPYVLSSSLGKMLAVDHLPYMVIAKPNGQIAARGLVNSREQIESLITAAQIGFPTIQAYLSEQKDAASHQKHGHHETQV